MKLKLPTIHLKRYREIAALLWKYGRSDLVRQMGVDDLFDAREEVKVNGPPRKNWPTTSKPWGRPLLKSASFSPAVRI